MEWPPEVPVTKEVYESARLWHNGVSRDWRELASPTLMKHIPPKEFSFSEVLFHTTHLLMIIFQIFWTIIPCAVQIKWYFQIFYHIFLPLGEHYECQLKGKTGTNKNPNYCVKNFEE